MTASSRPAGREAGRARTRLREVPENFDRRDAWRVVKRAGGLFRPFLGRIYAIALLVLVTSALGLAPVELTRQVVAEGTDLAEQVANGIDRSQLSLWRINLLWGARGRPDVMLVSPRRIRRPAFVRDRGDRSWPTPFGRRVRSCFQDRPSP